MNTLSLRVDGKVIVLTGGYGFLGSAIAESLHLHGARVIIAGKSKDEFDKKFDDKSGIFFEAMDTASTASISRSFSEILEKHKRIDVLINNAFFIKGHSPEKLNDEEWSYGIDGVLGSVFRCMREIIPVFQRQMAGKIINVSSMYGLVAPDFDVYESSPSFLSPPHYGAAKAGVLQLTRYYASYLGKWNIQVNSVSPGPYPSEKVQEDEVFIQKLADKTCMGSIGKPEQVAGAFTFLASEAANFITGQNIIVDGGWTIK